MKTILSILKPIALLLLLIQFFSCQKTLDESTPVLPDPVDDSTYQLIPVRLIMTSNGEEYYDSLVYDTERRLIEEWIIDSDGVGKIVYTYKNNEPVSMESYSLSPEQINDKSVYGAKINNTIKETFTNYITSDNTPFVTTRTYLFNEKGQLMKGMLADGTVFEELTWDQKGRVSTLWYKESSDLNLVYTYDDKKGLFSSVNSPFFFDAFLSTTIANFSVNNLKETTVTHKSGNDTVVEKTTYSYTYNKDGYPETITQSDQFEELLIKIEYRKVK